jgi:hypothetical protein
MVREKRATGSPPTLTRFAPRQNYRADRFLVAGFGSGSGVVVSPSGVVSTPVTWPAMGCAGVSGGAASGQIKPITPANRNGAAAAQVVVPDMAASSVEVRTATPWPVVTWPSHDFNELFNICSP